MKFVYYSRNYKGNYRFSLMFCMCLAAMWFRRLTKTIFGHRSINTRYTHLSPLLLIMKKQVYSLPPKVFLLHGVIVFLIRGNTNQQLLCKRLRNIRNRIVLRILDVRFLEIFKKLCAVVSSGLRKS